MNQEEPYTFGYEDYPSYQEREDIKNRAWDGFANGSLSLKMHCLIHGIIWAHYWRAREALEARPKLENKVLKTFYKNYSKDMSLCIDKYTENWLYSMGHIPHKELMEKIEKTYYYKPKINKYLPLGMTMYQNIEEE